MNSFLALKQLVQSMNWLLSNVLYHIDPSHIFYIVLLMHLFIYIDLQIIRKENTGHPREIGLHKENSEILEMTQCLAL